MVDTWFEKMVSKNEFETVSKISETGKKHRLKQWGRQFKEHLSLRCPPELARIKLKPPLDLVGPRFGEMGQEILLGAASGLGDQGPIFPAQDAFECMPLFDASVEGAGGLVQVEDATPAYWIVGAERQDAIEFSPVLVSSSG